MLRGWVFCHLSRLEGLQDRGSWYANRVQKKSMLGEGEKSLGQTPRGWGRWLRESHSSLMPWFLLEVENQVQREDGELAT